MNEYGTELPPGSFFFLNTFIRFIECAEGRDIIGLETPSSSIRQVKNREMNNRMLVPYELFLLCLGLELV